MSLGAVAINLGPNFVPCMKQQMANKAAGRPYNTSQCLPGQRSGAAAGGGGSFAGIPTWGWIAGGAVLAGSVWYFMLRKPTAA